MAGLLLGPPNTMRSLFVWITLLLGLIATVAQADSNIASTSNGVCLSTKPSSSDTSCDGYLIAKAGETTEILTSRDDAPVVHHAASSFAADLIQMVASSNVVVRNVTAASMKMQQQGQKKERTIIVGSVDGSSVMQELVSMDQGVAKEADRVKGQWESWSSTMLDSGSGLVLMGSDKRGAAYALYTLSEEMGISPWKWFADVKPTQSHSAVYYSPSSSSTSFGSNACSHGPPLVKYRGIFLNDEAPALTNWA